MNGIEALWAIRFYNANNPANKEDGGVVVFETERVFGGDSAAYYVGTYSVKSGFTCNVVSKLHNENGVMIVPNAKELNLSTNSIAMGSISEGQFTVIADIKEAPGAKLGIDFRRIAELP